MWNPTKDGSDHINVYSKGKTELGRLLTNFAHTPFTHPEHGRFESVEGFWYYLATGCKHNRLRTLWGFQAKQEGCVLPRVHYPGFKAAIGEAIELKLEQNEPLQTLFVSSTLPLAHYYVYGNKVVTANQHQWQIDLLTELRDLWQNA